MGKFNKKKALAIACALSFMTNMGASVVAPMFVYAESFESYDERQKRYEEYQRQLRLKKIDEAKAKYRNIVSNNGMDASEFESIITKAATTEVDTGSVAQGINIVENELTAAINHKLEAENQKMMESNNNESGESGSENSVVDQVIGLGTAYATTSATTSAATGGLNPNATIAYQAILGVIGGIPLSNSVSYTPSGSKGTYVCVPASSTALHPAANDSVTYTCTGVPFAPNTVIVPPVQQITMNPSEGGSISQSIQGATLTYHEDWVEVNACGASISANAYDGGNTMSDSIYGGFSSYEEWRKQIEALGSIGEEYLKNMDNGFDTGDAGLNGYDEYKTGDASSSLGEAVYGSSSGDGDVYPDSGVYPTDTDGYTNDVLNDMYGDGDGSFNSGGVDWASSNSDGNLEGTDIDEYFNSGGGDYSIDGENIGGLTNDIMGIDSSFGSTDGEYGANGIASDLAGIATTNEDGVPGYYDADGNFVPYDKEAYERFKAMNAERESMGEMGMSWEDFKAKFGLNDIGNEMFGDMKDNKSSILNTISKLKNTLSSLFGGENVATMNEQQMFDAAKKFLLANGYSLDDLANGANYDEGSIYTEPKIAWDMNRITKLLKLNKIEITDENDKVVTPKKSALGSATMSGSGYLKSAQQQNKNAKNNK